MKKKYDLVILPPDSIHLSVRDSLYEVRIFFNKILDGVLTKYPELDYIIKYRGDQQRRNFPVDYPNIAVGYGQFIDYCKSETIVVGPIGTACIEALDNGLKYFPYDDQLNSIGINSSVYKHLQKFLFTAGDFRELISNINNSKIYKNGFSKKDILHQDGVRLEEIINQILSDYY